ncbi:MAG TPA: glycosyltransferase, partial [Pseudosphingobacterium sp.]|nr:glycosyltransferase [Pseudosphingobacterium sp.]
MEVKLHIFIRSMEMAGGKERAVANISNRLGGDYAVAIVTLDGSLGSFYEISTNVHRTQFNCLRFLGKAKNITNVFTFFADVKRLASWIKKEKPDLLIGTDFLLNFMLLLAKCLVLLKTKVIAWEHMAFEDPMLMKRPFLLKLRNFFYRFLDGIVVLTTHDMELCERKGLNSTYIPNARSFKVTQKTDPLQQRILTIARLSPQKGLDLYIQVIQKLKNKIGNWKFILVINEDTIPLQTLESMITDAALSPFVTIKPAKADVLSYYKDASIYLMTSRYEGLPMVLIEAQECGLVCVSFNCKTGPSSI